MWRFLRVPVIEGSLSVTTPDSNLVVAVKKKMEHKKKSWIKLGTFKFNIVKKDGAQNRGGKLNQVYGTASREFNLQRVL